MCKLSDALKVIEDRLGQIHAYYAKQLVSAGLGEYLCAILNNLVVGSIFFYKLVDGLGVVYYVAVRRDFEGSGIGKMLVLSAEEVLSDIGCGAYLASTKVSNNASRTMFKSLGYEEFELNDVYRLYGSETDLLIKGLCAYEDDVVLIKGLDLGDVIRILRKNRRDVNGFWRKACYKPWIELWRR